MVVARPKPLKEDRVDIFNCIWWWGHQKLGLVLLHVNKRLFTKNNHKRSRQEDSDLAAQRGKMKGKMGKGGKTKQRTKVGGSDL